MLAFRDVIVKRPARLRAVAALALASVLVLSACALSFNGHGAIPSAAGGPDATIGINFYCTQTAAGGTICNGGEARGEYADQAAGVALHFSGALVSGGPALGYNNCMSSALSYTTKREQGQGSGVALVLACDNGRPGTGNDFVAIQVVSGPFTGYTNAGLLTTGNLMAH